MTKRKSLSLLLSFTLFVTMCLGAITPAHVSAASKATIKLAKSGYTATVYGKASSTLWFYTLDGKPSFCLERDSMTGNGINYSKAGYGKLGLSKDQWRELNYIANIGYNKTKSRTSAAWRGATQLYMWKRLKDWKIKNNKSAYGNTSSLPGYSDKAKTIKEGVQTYKKIKENPVSFNNKTEYFNLKKNTGDSRTLTDSKKVLSHYKIKSISGKSGVTASIDGNKLKINVSKSAEAGVRTIKLSWSPYTPVTDEAQMFFTSAAQTQVIAGGIDGETATVKVNLKRYEETEKTGNIEIDKVIDALGEDANYSLIGETPDYTKIKFGFYAKTDIKNAAGTVKYKAGTLINTYTCTADGRIYISNILPGTYTLKELETLPGLVFPDDEYEIVAKKNSSGNVDVDADTENVEMKSNYNLENAEVVKALNTISIDAGDEFDAEKAVEMAKASASALDESTLEQETPTETDPIEVSADLSNIDTTTPGIYTINFVTAKGSTIATRLLVNNPNADSGEYEAVIFNDTTKVSVTKTDVTGEEEIPGAELRLTDSEGNTVVEWTSTDEPYVVEGLTAGKEYTLTEVVAPDGYVLSSDSVTFTIDNAPDMQQHYMKDKWVEFYKTDKDGNIITGGEFQIIDKETEEIAEEFKGEFQDIGKTTEEGKGYYVSNLKTGHTYVVHETKAPAGYMIAEDVEFTVENDEENITVVMEDEKSEIKTTATVGGEHVGKAGKDTELVDKVEYTNLNVGEEYTLKGTLMDSEGNPIKIDDKEITSEVKFTPKEANGYQNMVFKFDASKLEGKTTVVFEELYVSGELAAEHKDKDDEGQTVHFPKIRTKANLSSDQKTVKDEVSYKNLIPGKEYEMVGWLVDESGRKIGGTEAKKTFTPSNADGSIVVTLNASSAKGTVVVFEECRLNGKIIGEHKDINDKDQTVKISKIRQIVKTGDDFSVWIFAILGVFALIGGFAFGRKLRMKKQ